MYYVQDAHSFWDFIYFIVLIVVGSFFMINLCLVVIATQFSETKKREMERMRAERAHFQSSSTLTSGSQPSGCYAQLFRYAGHLLRRAHRRLLPACCLLRRRRREQLPIALRPTPRHAQPPSDDSTLSPQAPYASPEISDIDLVASPRDTAAHRATEHSTTKQSSPNSLTCAELLAIGAAQTTVLAGFENVQQFALQSFCSNADRGEKHFSAPQLLFYSPEGGTEEGWSESGGGWWARQQARAKALTDHRYFQRGILTAILVNTLSMGVEYHNQAEELTLAVELSNAVFTAVFCLEMALKVCAEGVCSYASSGFNVFDGAIVLLSLAEVCQSSGSGLSVLRTFRLLRILKLVRFLPALRRQLLVMLRTVDNVAVFFALLILFIFIFSILGMNLFGCKFCKTLPDGKTHCDRKNFDSLLWAIVTVFQILTQEDWNVVLFNGMEKTSHWAALYFVALMTFGNYVLFNLLVAILVEGFSQEDDKRESSRSCSLCEKQDCEDSFDDPKDNIEKEIKMRAYPYVLRVVKGGASTDLCFPPVITHTAATPQGSPNALQRISPGPDLNGVLTSLPIPGLPPGSRRSSVIVALSRHSSIVSNISRKSSLGQCFSLQAGWRRKRSDSSDNGSEEVVLNNMSPGPEAGHCNGSIPTLQNTPNNKVGGSPRASSNSLHSGSRDEFKPNNLDSAPDTPTQKMCWCFEPKGWIKDREDYSLFLFSKSNCFRRACVRVSANRWFDYSILVVIASNCVTLAMERPTIPPRSLERRLLTAANYLFIAVFTFEMLVKVVARGLWCGRGAYFKSGWNMMDGTVVIISLVDVLLSFVADGSPKIFGMLRVFRLLRSLRPLRVINRAPGLKLVVQTLLSSLRPIGNIVLICCTFFIIFGILGVQLFKGSLYYCEGPTASRVRNKFECLQDPRNTWQNRKYNFDNLGQPVENYNEWRLLYFISFLLLVAFFVLNMFVGVVVENFHRCREQQEREERARRAAKRAKKMDKKRRKMREPPYHANYSSPRLLVHGVITSKYFDLAIAAVIGLNVVTMAMEFYMMPQRLESALRAFNYFFTAVFILEAAMKMVALGFLKYLKNRWNQLDVVIVGLSIAGIVLEKMESDLIPINPTIIRVFRVLRIARVLKLLKMAKGIRALLDTVMQALPQVGNLGLLFFLLFFIFAALGVELFGRLECTEDVPCEGLGQHAHFKDFGMAFLTLFRVATGDNWNGIMKDTLRETCDRSAECVRNCCPSPLVAPLYFVVFVLAAQFVLVNVVVAVLMKHLEESHRAADDELEMERELLAEEQEWRREQEQAASARPHKTLIKMASLPPNFVFPFDGADDPSVRRPSLCQRLSLDCGRPDVNIRQASPDDEGKVSVADLSPAPP
ncbi:voltage-dependent T-type calcium channel subunit alpha-1I [Caerostris darwini]|uniref:Voltage-dependent T-type calcium channel subunit alpha n=1 Tax=Caerostris darwini TaxID=1538125 RepID=A0AAV4U3V8_9ARAC|nr:voltage-dependent T-type calcium channel subunit alpha-1I [Caerostris darwini]